jgi:rare lipoprotein A (peptidoglycan hydrolase)
MLPGPNMSSGYTERGWASFVANSFWGRPTASGEPYDPGRYTAAHNALPFGTMAKVTNLSNGRQVDVVINDRFPHYPGRIINLSRAASDHLGMTPQQMAEVEVQASAPPMQPVYAPQQPVYAPQQPVYAPQQPVYAPQQPVYAPQQMQQPVYAPINQPPPMAPAAPQPYAPSTPSSGYPWQSR